MLVIADYIIWTQPHSVLNVNALIGAFNQEKALVGAFSMNLKSSGTFGLSEAGPAWPWPDRHGA